MNLTITFGKVAFRAISQSISGSVNGTNMFGITDFVEGVLDDENGSLFENIKRPFKAVSLLETQNDYTLTLAINDDVVTALNQKPENFPDHVEIALKKGWNRDITQPENNITVVRAP